MSRTNTEKSIVVLISGSGSNLQAILDATQPGGRLHGTGRVTQVISNRKAAFGLTRAQNLNIPTAVLSLKTWLGKNPGKRREHYDEVLAKAVLAGAEGRSAQAIEEMAASAEADESNKSDLNSEPKPNLVVLAGFMHIVSPEFLRVLESVPCINLHPALPGQFDGIEAIKRAHDAFVQGTLKDNKTGVMVHEVIAEVDRGAPIVVEEVGCKTGESLEDLEGRIHVVEHKIIVEAAYKVLHREAK